MTHICVTQPWWVTSVLTKTSHGPLYHYWMVEIQWDHNLNTVSVYKVLSTIQCLIYSGNLYSPELARKYIKISRTYIIWRLTYRVILISLSVSSMFLYPPLQRSWKGGILVSPCPSVPPSARPSVRLWTESYPLCIFKNTHLQGSISYFHILSSNFRRCVACNARFKIEKFEILANFLNL